MAALRPLTDEALARVIERLRNPKPGGKVEAARQFGVDVTLLIEQVKLSPAERADRMHGLAVAAESVRGMAVKTGQRNDYRAEIASTETSLAIPPVPPNARPRPSAAAVAAATQSQPTPSRPA